jgi:hypothetical protein
MSWTFRCMKRHTKVPDHLKKFERPWYEIIEFYEEENGEIYWTERGQGPCGESLEECKHDYDLMSEAFTMPILDEEELEHKIAAKIKNLM